MNNFDRAIFEEKIEDLEEKLDKVSIMLQQVIDLNSNQEGPLSPPRQAAFLLGYIDDDGKPQGETIRRMCRERRVFRPGTEVIKAGSRWGIDVARYRKRMAKEQAMTRRV